MRLGTPNSPSAVRVMLLGSGELGKEVAIELQRLGCEVIACDRYEGAPAMQVAHRSHVLAMTDAAALRAVIEAERPHLVVPEIEAIATDELVKIEAEGLAVVIPTARAVGMTVARPSASMRTSSSVAMASISGTIRCGCSASTTERRAKASVIVMTWLRWATCMAGAFG